MTLIGVSLLFYSLSINGLMGYILAIASGLLMREGYDWYMDNITDRSSKHDKGTR